jgi:hypothetical protein
MGCHIEGALRVEFKRQKLPSWPEWKGEQFGSIVAAPSIAAGLRVKANGASTSSNKRVSSKESSKCMFFLLTASLCKIQSMFRAQSRRERRQHSPAARWLATFILITSFAAYIKVQAELNEEVVLLI